MATHGCGRCVNIDIMAAGEVTVLVGVNKYNYLCLFQLTVRLKIGDLHKVRNELWDARTKWKDFGLALGMDVNTLDNIDSLQRGDSGNCLRDMLSEWLKGANDPPRTWSTIAAALREVKSLEAIAEEIESKHGLVRKPAPVATKPPNTEPDKGMNTESGRLHVITILVWVPAPS